MFIWKNITFAYGMQGQPVLKQLDLSASEGSMTVITGPSGCGKSTLLYIGAGLYPEHTGVLQEGHVSIDNRPVADLSAQERAGLVGMLFQNADLQFCMDTVANEILFCLENIQVSPDTMDARMQQALAFCEITHLQHRNLHTLSGGEKQKVALACLVALQPKWLLLDEPFANIDPRTTKEIVCKLVQLRDEQSVGIIAVDHQLEHWMDAADRIVLMDEQGCIACDNLLPSDLPDHLLMSHHVQPPGKPYRIQAHNKPRPTKHSKPILTVDELCVQANETIILDHVSTSFYAGQTHAIIGASGAGKTTLFHTLLGLYSYTGSIQLCNTELAKMRKKQRNQMMGFVFQSPQDQFVANTVDEEIAASLKHCGQSVDLQSDISAELQTIGLLPYRQVSPYMLSQGQQRRLAVATMLACKCNLLVCDEPTYAQDRTATRAIMDTLQQQVEERGLTLIFSTHNIQLAKEYAQHIYSMEEGKIVKTHASCL